MICVVRLAVINVSRSYHETEQLAFLVTDKVEFESKEPSHGAFASLRNPLESLVDVDALVLADPQRRAIHETDASTFAKQHLLDEQGKRNGNIFLLLHKTVVGNKFWEQVTQVLRNMLHIEMLQAAIAGIVKEDDDNHHLSLG